MAVEDQVVYDLELLAFEGTPLDDRIDRRSLITETQEVIRCSPVLLGSTKVEEGRVNMTRAAAYAGNGRVVFAPRAVARYTIPHELSHIVHTRMGRSSQDTGHGHRFRGIYVEMTGLIFGDQYAERLRDVFREAGLIVTAANLPRISYEPLIDIDRMAQATQQVRWL